MDIPGFARISGLCNYVWVELPEDRLGLLALIGVFSEWPLRSAVVSRPHWEYDRLLIFLDHSIN